MKHIKSEISVTYQAGYECEACKVINVVYTDIQPEHCLNCLEPKLSKKWAHTIKTSTTVEEA